MKKDNFIMLALALVCIANSSQLDARRRYSGGPRTYGTYGGRWPTSGITGSGFGGRYSSGQRPQVGGKWKVSTGSGFGGRYSSGQRPQVGGKWKVSTGKGFGGRYSSGQRPQVGGKWKVSTGKGFGGRYSSGQRPQVGGKWPTTGSGFDPFGATEVD